MLGDEAHGQATADLLAGALGGLGLAAFVCDPQGTVLALSPQAQPVLARGVLQVRAGRLCAANGCAAALKAALDKARSAPQATGSVVLRHRDAHEVLDLVALPGGLMAVVRGGAREDAVARALIRTAFGLTPTESAIALQVAQGESTDEIATGRKISVATLRSHIKAAFCKIGVNRRAELVARLQPFR